jgi:hypothetical protein
VRFVVPDLDQLGAALLHDVGDAERAADLDELAARHDHRALRRERRQGEQDRRRAVVHGERRLGAGQSREPALDAGAAIAAPAGVEVELQAGVAARDRVDGATRRHRERSAAEVGVQHDARGVQHATELRPAAGVDACRDARGDRIFRRRAVAAGAQPRALGGQLLAHGLDDERARMRIERGRERRMLEQRLDRGQRAERRRRARGLVGHAAGESNARRVV